MNYYKGENFDDLIKEGTYLVDFYADWCGPCKMLGMVLEEVSKESNVKILKVNIDTHEQLASQFRVMSIPYLVLFENGIEKKHNLGFLTKEDLVRFIED